MKFQHQAENQAYHAMVRRCTDPDDDKFENYGGRGIKVCPRWLEGGYPVFLEDMGPRPAGHSLDRINNDGDYSPENCRWATAKEQARNRRSNRVLTLNGVSRTLSEWADEIGIRAGTIRRRLHYGWSVERALTTPHQGHGGVRNA